MSTQQTFDAAYVDDTVQLGIGEMDATLDGIDEALGDTIAGASQPKPEELASLFFKQQIHYPPEAFAYPGTGVPCPTCSGTLQTQTGPCPTCDEGQGPTGQVGSVVTASPWILMLEFAENGSDWLNRFTRFTDKHGAA